METRTETAADAEATRWTCYGSVRGGCGVRHRSREAAERHCAEDMRAITRRQSSGSLTRACSDRRPLPADGPMSADGKPLHGPPIRGESATRTLSQLATEAEVRVLRLAAEHVPCSLSRYVLEAALGRAVVDLRGVGLDDEARRAEELIEAGSGSG